MTTFVSFGGHEYDLNACSIRKLIEIHNKAASLLGAGFKPVNSFKTKPIALKRTRIVALKAAELAPPKAKAKAAIKVRKAKGFIFNFPPKPELKAHRKGTPGRAKLIELLHGTKGLTFDECLKATWAKRADMTPELQRRTTYEGLRLLHHYLGWGMRQDDEGRITIYHPKA